MDLLSARFPHESIASKRAAFAKKSMEQAKKYIAELEYNRPEDNPKPVINHTPSPIMVLNGSHPVVSETIFTANPTVAGARRSTFENFSSALTAQNMGRFVSQVDRDLVIHPDLRDVASSIIGYTGLNGQTAQELIVLVIDQKIVHVRRENTENGKITLSIQRRDALALGAFCNYVAYTLQKTGRVEFFDRTKMSSRHQIKNQLSPLMHRRHVL